MGKLDLMEAWAAMYLPIADYQSTVNHLIISRLDSDVQATLVDLLPEGEGEFMTWKPETLFQQIEDRLENNWEKIRKYTKTDSISTMRRHCLEMNLSSSKSTYAVCTTR